MRRLRPSLVLAMTLYALGAWTFTWFARTFLRQLCSASLGLGH